MHTLRRGLILMPLLLLCLALVACGGGSGDGDDTNNDTGNTGNTGNTGDTGDSGDEAPDSDWTDDSLPAIPASLADFGAGIPDAPQERPVFVDLNAATPSVAISMDQLGSWWSHEQETWTETSDGETETSHYDSYYLTSDSIAAIAVDGDTVNGIVSVETYYEMSDVVEEGDSPWNGYDWTTALLAGNDGWWWSGDYDDGELYDVSAFVPRAMDAGDQWREVTDWDEDGQIDQVLVATVAAVDVTGPNGDAGWIQIVLKGVSRTDGAFGSEEAWRQEAYYHPRRNIVTYTGDSSILYRDEAGMPDGTSDVSISLELIDENALPESLRSFASGDS